jgi:hypothetical protein
MIDSPQVLQLSDREFRLLVSIWCLVSEAGKKGILPYTVETLRLRVMPKSRPGDMSKMISMLKKLDLLVEEGGTFIVPRWDIHQYEYKSRIPQNRSDMKL